MFEDLVFAQVDQGKPFPSHYVLELACSAQRINGNYIKEGEAVHDAEGKFLYIKQANKQMMLATADPHFWTGEPKDRPALLKIKTEDTELANTIKSHFKKLMFAAVAGDNDFFTTVNSLLNSETIGHKMFGYVACLPNVYKRDYAKTQIRKQAQTLNNSYLANIGETLYDLDCEVIESIKSKNFDAWNICAIINNRMVSWFSKTDMQVGACVVIRAKVKDHSKHWDHGTCVTRLNYVKAAQ
jgi:hypothetical protein